MTVTTNDKKWLKKSQIAGGGTPIALAGQGDQLWIGSPAGLFVLHDDSQQIVPVVHEIPLASVQAIVQAGDRLLAAGLPFNLVYSGDGGDHWLRATVEGADRPITALAPSPNILNDGVVLASTAGQGVLRSSDGGRYWEFATFGLEDYNVLSIACAPEWSPASEIAIAATADGIFQSPNGGRAWRKSKFSGQMPENFIAQSFLFSPNFATDQRIFAGTEAHGIWLSEDGGLSWSPTNTPLNNQSVTAFAADVANREKQTLYAAGGSGALYASKNLGHSWETVAQLETPITCLAIQQGQLFAGLFNGGVKNIDKDQDGFGPLRRFNKLKVLNDEGWLIEESTGEQWQSPAGESGWSKVEPAQEAILGPPLNRVIVSCPNGAVTLGEDGKSYKIWWQSASGEAWQPVGTHLGYGRVPRLAVLADDSGPAVALTLGADCLIFKDGAWHTHRLGTEGLPLSAVVGLANGTIVSATFDQLHMFDGTSWSSIDGPTNNPLVDLAVSQTGSILALTTNGTIYELS